MTVPPLALRIALPALAVGLAAYALFRQAPRQPPPDLSLVQTREDVRVIYPPGRHATVVLPDGSRREVRSFLNVAAPMRYGDYVWSDAARPSGPSWVRIDLARQLISVFRGGDEIGTALILYGTDGKPTPTGQFHILERETMHHSTLYDAPMPYMLRLTADGVAIHASDVRAGAATHGCIGVPPEFARRMFARMRQGDLVVIQPAVRSAAG